MKLLFRKCLLVSCLILSMLGEGQLYAQIDSLTHLLPSLNEDSTKVNTLNYLSSLLIPKYNHQAESFLQEAIVLSDQISFFKGKGQALYHLAIVYQQQNNYQKAQDTFLKALLLTEEVADEQTRAEVLNGLGTTHYFFGEYQKALSTYLEAFQLSELIGNQALAAKSLANIASIYKEEKQYQKAFENYNLALAIRKKNKNKKEIAFLLNRIGEVYAAQKKYQLAINTIQKALAIYKEIFDKRGQAITSMALGDLYLRAEQYNVSLAYYNKAKDILGLLNYKVELYTCLNQIGKIYTNLAEYTKAITFHRQALAIAKKIGAKEGLKQIYKDLASAYKSSGDYQQAIEHLEIYNQLQDELHNEGRINKMEEMIARFEIGETEKELEIKTLAIKKQNIEKEKQDLQITLLIFGLFLVILIASLLFRVNTQRKKVNKAIILKSKALERQKNKIKQQKHEIEESHQIVTSLVSIGQRIAAVMDMPILSEVVRENIQLLMKIDAFGIGVLDKQTAQIIFKNYFEKPQNLSNLKRNIDIPNDLISWAITHKQSIFINDIDRDASEFVLDFKPGIGNISPQSLIYLPLIIQKEVLGILVLQSKDKNIYTQSHLNLLQSLASYISIAICNAQTFKGLQSANQIIKRKNDNILDSIRYAKTIQQAILPSSKDMLDLFPKHFVMYKPKDVVSGDFYTIVYSENKIYLAVADCTGHGVPGAFVSMVGNQLLREIIKYEKITEPAHILKKLHKELGKRLQQTGQRGKNNDAIDMGLCLIEESEDKKYLKKITYAGAKRPLYLLKNGVLERIRGNKHPVGGWYKQNERNFEQEIIYVAKGDCIYLTTDGYVDQNNPQGKKYGSVQLMKDFERISALKIEKQAEILKTNFEAHSQNMEQRDDVTILGLKFCKA